VASNQRSRVLTPSSQEDLGLADALAQLSFAVHGTLARVAADHDLSIVQARLLGILRDRRPSITELASFLAVDKSSVTGLVDRAEQRGLVRRIASPLDGRGVQVAITPAGRNLINRAATAFEAEVAVLVADLNSVQRKRLSADASRVVAAEARRRGINLFDSTTRSPESPSTG
jgi:MarR family transcriptional regulator, lower aerobic nicotinate degradation pathway regulator